MRAAGFRSKEAAVRVGCAGIHVLNLLHVQQRSALSRVSVVIGDVDRAHGATGRLQSCTDLCSLLQRASSDWR